MQKSRRQLQDEFVIRLVKMKSEAGKIGLFKTMHKIDEATTTVGWEIAEQIKEQKHHPRYQL